jgi:hypothetical protein
MSTIDRSSEIWQVKDSFVSSYLKRPRRGAIRSFALGPPVPDPDENVVGVGITSHPEDMSQPILTAFVTKKFDDSAIPVAHRLPTDYEGHQLRVEEVGLFQRLVLAPPYPDPKSPNCLPAKSGCSVSISGRPDTTGTITAFVKDAQGVKYLLSCNHVLADENAGVKNQTAIIHSGQADQPAGQVPPAFATLSNFVNLDTVGLNKVDCAIATLADPANTLNQILAIGAINGTTAPQLNMPVHAFGRTSTYMNGTITAVGVTANIAYGLGTLSFDDQIFVSGSQPGAPFSAAGDSGSLVVEVATGKAVAMVIAGSPLRTVASDFANIVAALGISLI